MINSTLTTGLAAILLANGLIGGCATGSQAEQGEVIGGVIGGVIGSQVGEGRGKTAAIIIGTLAGTMIGRHIGETMDDVDRMQTATVLNDAKTGQVTTWINPDNGNRYTVTPTRTIERTEGPCREFRLDARVGDKPNQEVYGTACLQPDGSWLVR